MKTIVNTKKPLKWVVLMLGVLFITNQNAQAQKETKPNQEIQTIFGPETSFGGYGGISLGVTRINNQEAISAGIRAAWILNHSLAVGFAGKGFVSELENELLPQNNYSYLGGGYGGVLIEPIVLGNRPINLSVPILFGAGGIGFESGDYNEYYDQFYSQLNDYDLFFIVEPGVELQLNLTPFFRVAFGAQYRFTTETELSTNFNDTDIAILDKGDLNDFTFNVTFKFGKF